MWWRPTCQCVGRSLRHRIGASGERTKHMALLGKQLCRLGLAALAVAGTTTVATLVGTESVAGAAGSPLTIVMITSLTGEGGSEFSQAPAGFNARLALANAQGGVNGHKLKGIVLDDQTSPTEIATA